LLSRLLVAGDAHSTLTRVLATNFHFLARVLAAAVVVVVVVVVASMSSLTPLLTHRDAKTSTRAMLGRLVRVQVLRPHQLV